jgi:D-alanine-D-alanine ligase
MIINLGVIFGGQTVEHEVSVISALQAIQNLNKDKYNVVPIYIAKDKTWYTGHMLEDIETYKSFDDLKKYSKKVVLCREGETFTLQTINGLFRKRVAELDIMFPIVHGNNVEDGSLAGYLETVGIPYVGSHVLGSALGQDKVVQKQILQASNVPVANYTWFYDNEYLENKDEIIKKVKKLGYPVIVKPATLGSSVGISKAKNENELNNSIEEALKYDNKILIEECIDNLVEVNSSVLGNHEYQRVSVLEEVMGVDEILSYSDKYLSSSKTKGMSGSKGMASASRIIPARISKELTEKISETSKEVFKLLNLSGVCRIDYLINSKTNKFYVNEPNTIPGSLAFYLWKESNLQYKDLLDEMISIAIKEYKNKSKKLRSFDTNIFEGFNGSKGVKGLKGLKS